MEEKIKLEGVLLCEGKYDKIKLETIFDCTIVPTNGFRIYKDKEKVKLIQTLAEKLPIYIITDSDSAGFQIRSYLKNLLQGKEVQHIYVPDIYGKEKRKANFSKEGKLGVEGIAREIIVKAVLQVVSPQVKREEKELVTNLDLYRLGLIGQNGSEERRKAVLKQLNLPAHLSAKGLVEVLNILYVRKQAITILEKTLL